jgi:hypothetical protein
VKIFLWSFFFLQTGALWGAYPVLQGKDLVSGRTVEWKAGGQPSLVVFLSPLCPCSRSHEKPLAKLASDFPSVRFLGIVSFAEKKQGEEYFKKSSLPFPVLPEPQSKWADAFSALNTPHAFLFDGTGALIFQGGVDNSGNAENATRFYLREALTALNEGKEIAEKQARPLGCPIRR